MFHRPVTQYITYELYKLVSEPIVMGDLTQSRAAIPFAGGPSTKLGKSGTAESLLEAQIQSLSREIQELFGTMSRSHGKEPETESNSSNQMNQAPRGNNGVDARPGEGMVPRYIELDFPVYDGSEDPLSWLHRCDQFFF